ncbi:hypothetical protein MHH81_07385 [Psychrobacillus sp. FSL H8-0484]|uniref:hypothetical protein n=1 Tax=Psychrobacillus sp. FSL H8-0484 TaxID=2921390 RepID=UPI0030F923A8
MKKTFFIALGLLLVFGTIIYLVEKDKGDNKTANNGDLEREIVEVGTTTALLETYSFEEAVSEAELIAEIEIDKYLEEIKEPSPKTLFDAKIINSYTNDSSLKDIKVLQQGTKEYSFNGNPLFEKDEKYILFLKKAVGDRFDGTDTYWILGEETNIYSIIDNNIIKKWALRDDVLTTIEIKDNRNINSNDNSNKDSQLLDKDLFEDIMKKVIEESK